MANIVLRITN